MQVSMVSNINKALYPKVFNKTPFYQSNVNFMGKNTSDIFEKNQDNKCVGNYADGLYIANPIGFYSININKQIDITKPQKFVDDEFGWTVEFDPKRQGQLVDKKTGKPIDVFILKIQDEADKNMVSFNFLSKDFQREYGHVELDRDWKAYRSASSKDYPKENIIGDRIVVHWLKNEDDEHIGGVGKLADKVAVKYCVENNITPNIVSLAGDDSHLAHYSRGKRFIQPNKYSSTYSFLMKNYNTSNPNEALKMLLEKSKKTGKPVDLSKWNEYYFYMYLPQDLVEKYKNEDY